MSCPLCIRRSRVETSQSTPTTNMIDFDGTRAGLRNLFNATPLEIDVDAVVIVGHREPEDALYQSLIDVATASGSPAIQVLGDALAPGAIVHAVHSGHSFARGLIGTDALYLRDEPVVRTEPAKVFPQR